MKFREDIQGLRALAVLSVVIYHISPSHLQGGFIGVDIFFVISGYLIIGQIVNKLKHQNFSYSEFYAKRFQRLFPAYFTTIAVSSVFAFLYFLPNEFKNFSFSLIASCFYISNFYFYTKSGYFDSELQNSPLLHTWSLSVEEQFYAVVPVLLAVTYKLIKTKLNYALVILGIFSFFLCLYFSKTDISFAFFSSITRFWQFILGGMVSIYATKITVNRLTGETLSSLSLLTLVASCFLISHDDFPGLKALIPTIATTLILAFSSHNQTSYKLLSIKPAKFFGDISYSLYLWHWPIIIFYPLILEKASGPIDKILVLLISIIIGIISYYVVEQKFRRTAYFNNKTIFGVVFSLSAVICLSTFLISKINYVRFSDEQRAYEAFMTEYKVNNFRSGYCFLSSTSPDEKLFDKNKCLSFDENKENILLIGDSHAAHWYSAIQEAISEKQTLSQITATGCKPTLYYTGKSYCTKLMQWAFEDAITADKVDTIIISARWQQNDIKHLLKTIDFLSEKGIYIIVLGPIIEYNQSLPRVLALSDSETDIFTASKYSHIKSLDALFKESFLKRNVEYHSILDLICGDNKSCTTVVEGSPIQFDYGHLTAQGAKEILSRTKLFKDERFLGDKEIPFDILNKNL